MFSPACYAAKVFVCQPHHPVDDALLRPLCVIITASTITLRGTMSELPDVFRAAVLRRYKFPISYDKWLAQQLIGRPSKEEFLTNDASRLTLHMAVLECVEQTMLRKAPSEVLKAVPPTQKRGLGILCKLTLSFCPTLRNYVRRVLDHKEMAYLAATSDRCVTKGPGVGRPVVVSATEILRGKLGYLLSDEYEQKKYSVQDKIHQVRLA